MFSKLFILLITLAICLPNILAGVTTTSKTEVLRAASTPKTPQHSDTFNGTTYDFYTKSKKSWFGSSNFCTSVNGRRLVEIRSSYVQNWIVSKIKRLGYGNCNFWTGGEAGYGSYDWNYGDKIQFFDWAHGQPDAIQRLSDDDVQDRIVLDRSYDFKWNDAHYDDVNCFICQRAAVASQVDNKIVE